MGIKLHSQYKAKEIKALILSQNILFWKQFFFFLYKIAKQEATLMGNKMMHQLKK